MSAGSDVDARCLANRWAPVDVAEVERLFRDLVALIGRAERAMPPQARQALQRAIVEAADTAHAALEGRGTTAAPDLACLDAWRTSLAPRRRPQPSAGQAGHPVSHGPYDSAGEWTFL